jgi:hypothetical protein
VTDAELLQIADTLRDAVAEAVAGVASAAV